MSHPHSVFSTAAARERKIAGTRKQATRHGPSWSNAESSPLGMIRGPEPEAAGTRCRGPAPPRKICNNLSIANAPARLLTSLGQWEEGGGGIHPKQEFHAAWLR
jgi:hypothetical protein